MKKNHILTIGLIALTVSCGKSQKEIDLKKSEIENEQKALTEQNKIELETDTKKLETPEKQIGLNSEVQNNIIHCENNKFIVKVDNLNNGDIRYISWNKPKTIFDEPNLILYDGKVKQQGTGGGYHYVFKNGEWNYVIENNLIGENLESMGIFLSLLKNGEQILYTKMTDLTTKEDYDLKSYSKADLIGNWWTPNYAVRKISFDTNGTFSFDNGDGKKLKGKYQLIDKSVNLTFNNGLYKILEIGGGKDNTSLTLMGDGENFVKEWEE